LKEQEDGNNIWSKEILKVLHLPVNVSRDLSMGPCTHLRRKFFFSYLGTLMRKVILPPAPTKKKILQNLRKEELIFS
jgi:hypothetical protein